MSTLSTIVFFLKKYGRFPSVGSFSSAGSTVAFDNISGFWQISTNLSLLD